MEGKLRTKKRQQHSPSNPFIGIFTRSKSQIYLHPNRSGRARSDTTRKRHHHLNLHSSRALPRKRRAQHEASDIDNISHFSIKDLRASRVFSPASIIEDEFCSNGGMGDFHSEINCEVEILNPIDSDSGEIRFSDMNAEVEKLDLGFCRDSKNLNNENPSFQLGSGDDHGCADRDDADGASAGGRGPVENGWNDRFEEGFSSRAKDLDVANTNFSQTKGEGGFCDVELRGDDGRVGILTEECIKMTPPDASIFSEPKPGENRRNGDQNGGISNGSVCDNDDGRLGSLDIVDQRKASISKSKLVLNSCTRRKVFRPPSSFSYRRLLPFLMAIAKDDPCVSKDEKFSLGVACKDQMLNGTKPKFSSIMDDFCSPKDEDGSAYSSSIKPSENEDIKNFETELSHKAHDLNHLTPSEFVGNSQLHNVDHRTKEGDNLSHGVVELTEEHVQMTPPDVDIFSKPEDNDNCGNKVEIVLQTNDHMLGKPMKGSINGNDSFSCETYCKKVNRKNDSTLKSKLILNPCSRLKVFKTPSSFSYRRLLPFLMDVRNDDSSNSFGASKSVQATKVENVSEEKIHLPALASHSQEFPRDTSETDCFSTEHHPGDSELNLPAAILTSDDGSSNNELTLTSAESIIEPYVPFDSQKECMTQVEHVISNQPRISEPAPVDVSSNLEMASPAISLCSPANHETLSTDGALEFSHHVSIANQEDCSVEHSKNAKSIEAVNLDQNSTKQEAFFPSGIPVDGLTKGILRRNPRGCRGLCNCLNCASFRLHADRAFEFSRNQMLDVDEMALELINELSYLRNMLEKSIVGSNDHAIVHVNQVTEACSKALKAEELAKCRLSQLNYDLNIHCRSMLLQRPRVRFANCIEENHSQGTLAKQIVEKNEKEEA